MSSASSYPHCALELKPSRLLLSFVLLLVLIAAAAPWLAQLAVLIALPLSMLVIAFALPLFRWARGVRHIVLRADGYWEIDDGRECAHKARHLLPGVLLGSGLLLLHWKCEQCGARLRAPVLHDNCDADAFRRLRARLRFTADEELFPPHGTKVRKPGS